MLVAGTVIHRGRVWINSGQTCGLEAWQGEMEDVGPDTRSGLPAALFLSLFPAEHYAESLRDVHT